MKKRRLSPIKKKKSKIKNLQGKPAAGEWGKRTRSKSNEKRGPEALCTKGTSQPIKARSKKGQNQAKKTASAQGGIKQKVGKIDAGSWKELDRRKASDTSLRHRRISTAGKKGPDRKSRPKSLTPCVRMGREIISEKKKKRLSS